MIARKLFWGLCAAATLPGLLTAALADGTRGGSGPCSHSTSSECYFEPDSNAVQLCGGEETQICASIGTQAACTGAERIERNGVTKKCCTSQDYVRCVSDSTWCWRKWKCKWVVGTGGTGSCMNDSQVDSSTTIYAKLEACPP